MRLQAANVQLRVALASVDEARRKNLVAGALAPGITVALEWEQEFRLHLMNRARLGRQPPDKALALAMAGPIGGFGTLDWRTTPRIAEIAPTQAFVAEVLVPLGTTEP